MKILYREGEYATVTETDCEDLILDPPQKKTCRLKDLDKNPSKVTFSEVTFKKTYREDLISHPPHYNSSSAHCTCGRQIQCVDITRHMGFNLGNVVKYLWRFEHKNGVEDLKKARWYLDDMIKSMK